MTFSEFVVLSLATWRLSSLVVRERGLFGVFTRLRAAFGIGHDEDSKPNTWPDAPIADLLSCVWCLSVWVGAGLSLAYLLSPSWTVGLSLPLALSAGAILLERVLKNGNR